jgi:3,4-dihydroxyphenylacetate 2,3-dioxygenase
MHVLDYAADPPFDVVRAAHAELGVADLDASARFYVDLLGFHLTERTADALYLRAMEDTHHHSLVLRRSDLAAVGHLAYRVRTPEDVQLAADHFESLGCETRWVEGVENGQGPAVRVQDPVGFTIEFFHEMSRVERLLQRFDLQRGAQPARVDHLNIQVPDVQRAFEHWASLGFRCTEYIAQDDAQDTLVAVWLHRKSTVHDVALTPGPGPQLHHIGVWVADTDSVLRTCDALAAADFVPSIERGPGRHGVSNAFYVYLRDPDGHRIELYTYDYYTGDPDLIPIRWSVDDVRRRSFWGHPIPESWWREASTICDLDGNPVETRAPNVIEEPVAVD